MFIQPNQLKAYLYQKLSTSPHSPYKSQNGKTFFLKSSNMPFTLHLNQPAKHPRVQQVFLCWVDAKNEKNLP